MPPYPHHPILQESFAIIDREIGAHDLPEAEYAVLRRIIHSTADFELQRWLRFSPGAIEGAIAALTARVPIITDVGMVRQGCQGVVQRTFQNPLIAAVDLADTAESGRTRTETGLLRAWQQHPGGIFVIGNAPTALQALCDRAATSTSKPALVIGAPVGFVGVEAAKASLAKTTIPHIRVDGRKGGSPVAAAIINALLIWAWEQQP
ncbi:MAG: cobalt-precorrin-8X methylmutase [Leptolyngbya sp. RL_3_1]|nr:cobalt-precorrin-8X methylmutase [Leptolyngbya sp. RL_3_1]